MEIGHWPHESKLFSNRPHAAGHIKIPLYYMQGKPGACGIHTENGVVDYAGFKMEESKLDGYLKTLENTDAADLSKADQFVFYINAYNAWTIKLILTGYPGVDSIKDLGGFFQSPYLKYDWSLNGN